MAGKGMGISKNSGVSHAQRNRAVRVEAKRDQLSNEGHLRHAIEIIDKLTDLVKPLDQLQIARLKIALDGKFKIIGKYMPDLKSIEIQATVTSKTEYENKDQQELIQLAKEKLLQLEQMNVIEGEVIDDN